MDKIVIIINVALLCLTRAQNRTFPKTFTFGTGSSAYQTEGAWDRDGKSENIWDHWIHNDPTHIKNNDTADVACDTYNNTFIPDGFYAYRSKVQHYSFSIPFTRILPTGFSNAINIKGIMHYQQVISDLQFFNITPMITLYYHDLPQSLQDIGGWTNPEMVKYFADYARICFQYFTGVDYWITFNDPRAICRKGYGEGTFAPGITSDGVGEYLCAYNVLKAHAAAYHIYKEEFPNLSGKISIALDMRWSEAATTSDIDAKIRRDAFEFGLYADPIYKGDWPKEVIDRVDYRSSKENFTNSRLPKFTAEEMNYINGTSDFMAINLYYAHVVEDDEEAEFGDPSYLKDMKVKEYLNPNWTLAVNQQPIVPLRATDALRWLDLNYNSPDIFITQNGVPDSSYRDSIRTNYLRDYLNAILDAILDYNVNVIGYTAWSLYDSFEWTDGYSYKFGFYTIDFNSTDRHKSSRLSIDFYREVALTFTIPEGETTTTSTTTITSTSTTDNTPGSATKVGLYPAFILATLLFIKLPF